MYEVCVAFYQHVSCEMNFAASAEQWTLWICCLAGIQTKNNLQLKPTFDIHLVLVQLQLFFFKCSCICSPNFYYHLFLSAFYINSYILSLLLFSIGLTLTCHGTQRATPGFRTCASLLIWYGCQISSSTIGRLYSQPFALLIDLVLSHFVSSSLFFHLILTPVS